MSKLALLVAAVLAIVPVSMAGGPTGTPFDAKLDLAGDATHHGNSALVPDAAFQYSLDVKGTITQIGNRLSGWLTGTINITYQDENDNTVVVDQEPITLKVEGTRAPFTASGVDGFRLTVQQTGQTGNLKAFVIPGAFTTGVSQNDDGSKDYAITDQGNGQAQFKDTQHWALDVAGDLTLSAQ